MKYLCLLYNETGTPDTEAARGPDAEPGEVLGDHLIAAHALGSEQTATTIRVRNGRLSAAEGAAGLAREHLRGVILIEARDLNEAIRLASRMPDARAGRIEIRPVMEPA